MTKIEALAKYLDVDVEDIEEQSYNEDLFVHGSAEFLVYTDEEADEAVKESIKETIFGFYPSFLAGETGLPQEVFKALSNCSGGNEAVLALVEKTCGLGSFVETAVSKDGRGHFLSSYDGTEDAEGDYFIYRTN